MLGDVAGMEVRGESPSEACEGLKSLSRLPLASPLRLETSVFELHEGKSRAQPCALGAQQERERELREMLRQARGEIEEQLKRQLEVQMDKDASIARLQEEVDVLQSTLAESDARAGELEKEVGARGMMLEYVTQELKELQANYLVAREQLRVAAENKVLSVCVSERGRQSVQTLTHLLMRTHSHTQTDTRMLLVSSCVVRVCREHASACGSVSWCCTYLWPRLHPKKAQNTRDLLCESSTD